jgi:predicted alpha/beta-fold hydrolase
MIKSSTFEPAWWLSNPHAQTIYRSLTRRQKAPITAFERLELPDGDFIGLSCASVGSRTQATSGL